tara:strand:- start:23 stop:151 length:129 start_codon:yes stop_codon:yes gene_type:complete
MFYLVQKKSSWQIHSTTQTALRALLEAKLLEAAFNLNPLERA